MRNKPSVLDPTAVPQEGTGNVPTYGSCMPTCHREGFREAIDCQRALPHAGEGGKGVVLRRGVDDVLIYFV